MTEHKYTSLIKIIIKEEHFKWHLEAFASELFIYTTFQKFGVRKIFYKEMNHFLFSKVALN